MRKKIFISGPYTNGDVARNVATAMDCAEFLINYNFTPYCPHLTHFLHMHNYQSKEIWLDLDKDWLTCCDGLFRLPGYSKGADEEEALARELGIPIFRSLDELCNHVWEDK